MRLLRRRRGGGRSCRVGVLLGSVLCKRVEVEEVRRV